ncbi:MAG TPA: pectinesterase family protein [Bryobacteraceae bacterium]|nr:pectinesterase family protein [Bryobacteraceae bacterium]
MMKIACLATLLSASMCADPKACFVLAASAAHAGAQDTARIQEALDLCNPGMAVVLKGSNESKEFHSGPLLLPRGTTLFIDRGATLLASRNIRDYDTPGSKCDPQAISGSPSCKPFIFSYQSPYSGIDGSGIIDGQGCPIIVADYESQGFHIAHVTLKNASRALTAIYKTIDASISGLTLLSAPTGILLSNAVQTQIVESHIRVSGFGITTEPTVLGPTSQILIRNLTLNGGRGLQMPDAKNVKTEQVPTQSASPSPAASPDTKTVLHFGEKGSLVVAQDGSGDFKTVQQAIDALPADGGEIFIKTGTYREVVTLRKPHVHIHGDPAADSAKTSVIFDYAAPTHGGTYNSSTFFVEADDETLDHFTVANDAGPHAGQAVALSVRSDRVIFDHMRFLGAQDTLYAASKHCYSDYGPCVPARQYFIDSYIEGGVDFIFGDAKAIFERCELHAIPTGNVMFTAQSKHTPDQDSGYVFKNCKLTGEKRSPGVIALGRAWRPYATVIFLNAEIDAPVIPAGWVEWLRFGKSTLETAYFAEYHSAGPGASPQTRESHSHQLTTEEAAKWASSSFLAGQDGWNPAAHFTNKLQ